METDTIKTAQGDLVITFLGHATLMVTFGGKTVHVDPVSAEADYTRLPAADLILISHDHHDHLDLEAVKLIRKPGTKIVGNPDAGRQIPGAIVLKTESLRQWTDSRLKRCRPITSGMRCSGCAFSSTGIGNGYVVTFGDKRVYFAGDTENYRK